MNQIIETFEGLPLIIKLVLLLFFGGIISPVYRIIRFLETRNTLTLVVGVVCLVTGVGNLVLEVLDIISELGHGRITLFV